MSLKDHAIPEEYITSDLARLTDKKSIKNAWEKNRISVIKYGRYFYVEQYDGAPSLFDLVVRETKRLFPELKCIYDEQNGK